MQIVFFPKFPFFKRVRYKVEGLRNALPLPSDFARLHKRSSCCIYGNDNVVEIDESVRGRLSIVVFGDHNRIHIGKEVIADTFIAIGGGGAPCNDTCVIIGKQTTFSGPCTLRAMENRSTITIGDDVMFSSGVQVWASDSHAILADTGALKNIGTHVSIGNHVWIGMDTKIGKNVKIGMGSIVGWGSVVTSGSYPERSILAGSPAQVRKEGISWDRNPPNHFINS